MPFWSQRVKDALTPKWVSITPTGILVLVGCFVIGMMAIFFTNNLFYFLVAMLLGFITISGVLSEVTIRGLSLRRTVPHDVHALSPVFVTMEVINNKRSLPSFCLEVTDEKLGAQAFLLQVRPGESGKQRYQAVFPKRGLFAFGRATISTAFPFGFFRKRSAFEGGESVLVLPPVRELDFLFKSQAVGSGDFRTAFKGEGTQLFSVREYRWGDSSRLIHWKSTARTTEVMIKELEREVSGRATLELAGGFGDRIETAVALAASLANVLHNRKIQYRVLCGQQATPFDTGPRHLNQVLRALALYDGSSLESPAVPSKEEFIVRLTAPGAKALPGRHSLEVGSEWDWLLEPAGLAGGAS